MCAQGLKLRLKSLQAWGGVSSGEKHIWKQRYGHGRLHGGERAHGACLDMPGKERRSFQQNGREFRCTPTTPNQQPPSNPQAANAYTII